MHIPRPQWASESEREERISKQKEEASQPEVTKAATTKSKKRGAKTAKPKEQEPIDDITYFNLPDYFGCIFVQFSSVDEALEARRNLHMLKYGGRTIECGFYDPELYENLKLQE